jgi:hypothetical protein
MSKSYLRKNKIGAQFAARTIEMIESPAFRVLSLSAHRVLARIEIEHAHHGGNDNGRLPVTKEQFVEYGIHDHAVAPAQRELEALGFIETEHGRAGNAEYRRPNLFRLTYRHTDRAAPTDEWKRVKTLEEAQSLASAARAEKSKSSGGKRPVSVAKTTTEKQISRRRKPPLQGKGAETTTTSIFRDPTPSRTATDGTRRRLERRRLEKDGGVRGRILSAHSAGPRNMTETEIRNQQTVDALLRELGELPSTP